MWWKVCPFWIRLVFDLLAALWRLLTLEPLPVALSGDDVLLFKRPTWLWLLFDFLVVFSSGGGPSIFTTWSSPRRAVFLSASGEGGGFNLRSQTARIW